MDDQMSCDPQSPDRGGQLITGQVAFPERTGPKPLLLPATAINTVGIPSPEKSNECFHMYLVFACTEFLKSHATTINCCCNNLSDVESLQNFLGILMFRH